MKKCILAFLMFALFAISSEAQIVISPTIVYLAKGVPSGTFTVLNGSTLPQEVNLSFRFGYPASNSLGRVSIDFGDTASAVKYSCASWVSASPMKFGLNPGQKEVVHLTVSPPANLPDGVYWTRLITVSQPQQNLVDTVQTGVRVNVGLELRQITAVMYETGTLETNVTLGHVHESRDSGSVHIYLPLKRDGNAPFLGAAVLDVSNENGNVVYSNRKLIAVYLGLVEDFPIPLSKLGAGKYNAVIRVTSDRPDIPPEHLLRISPLSKSFSFTLK